MLAAHNNHPDCVQPLLGESKMKNKFGGTALTLSAAKGNVECVRILAKQELGILVHDGWTALMYATWNNHPDCVLLLLGEAKTKNSSGYTALMQAASKGYKVCVEILAR